MWFLLRFVEKFQFSPELIGVGKSNERQLISIECPGQLESVSGLPPRLGRHHLEVRRVIVTPQLGDHGGSC